LLDVPTARSTHARPTARVGGIALAIGVAGGLGLLAWRGHRGLDAAGAWIPYLVPAFGFFAIGLADDRWRLRPVLKFPAQGAIAALAVALGLRWGGEGLGPFGVLSFGPLAPFMTWLWIVAVVTLVNFLDGLDLITAATGIVVLAAGAGGAAGPGGGLLYGVAAAALLGLAFWNVTPARVFPGDAGTHLLGFLAATVACDLPPADPVAVPYAVALPWVAASAPLLPGAIDVAWGLVGKARRGIALYAAHNDHLSQRLTKARDSHVAVALRYGALAAIGLLLVTQVAPRWGLLPCVVLGLLVLLAHLGQAWRATRAIPWGGRGRTPPG
jgi:UDP-GlcNAc:undecaprenyl-phosphate GlcNAc-1-phosphate transferase